ncbi:hypothetical protein Tco_1508988 [Tanacetum coccineum]
MLSKKYKFQYRLSSNSGTLPSQTVTNPREHVNAITTRSGLKLEKGPSAPLFLPHGCLLLFKEHGQKNPGDVDGQSANQSSESTAQPNSPEPDSYQPKLPYPERMKVRERDTPSAQQSRYKDEIPEGFNRVLWGDLMIMFNPSDEDEFWNSQQDWNVVSWKLHGSSGVHTLMTDEGLVIHMLVEKQYPLRKKVLVQMLELKLESEEDNTMELELIRFVKKLIAKLEPENSDGNEKDL